MNICFGFAELICPLVGSNGLEPSTSRLSGARSNHLSYEPIQFFRFFVPLIPTRHTFIWLVEMMGFEPMTPCLQGRCSPNWATPPYVASQMNCASHMNSLRDELASPWSIASQYLGFCCFLRFKRSFKIEQRTQKTLLSRLASNFVFVSADSP